MLRAIGKGANWIVAIIVMAITLVLRAALAIFTVFFAVELLREMWSLIDPAHLDSLKSVGGIAGLFVMGVLILATIGELLDPFELLEALRGAKLETGSGDMRIAEPGDLKDSGIFGGH